MEIGGVPLTFQEQLLGEALAKKVRSEVTNELTAITTDSYSPHADFSAEFEKKNMNLCQLKDRFHQLRNRVLEEKGRCTLKCLSLASILTIIWGFISVRQQQNQNFYQIQNILDLVPTNKKIEFNKSFVDLVTQSGQKPYFAQSCAGAPLHSCLNRANVQDACAIHRSLTQTCHELAKLSLLVDHHGGSRPQRYEILEILQIGRGIRDEVDRFTLIQSTQCIKVEAWPNLQGHFLSIDPQTLAPVQNTIPLEQLLQVDLSLSIQDLTELFSIQNGVQGLYRVRDEATSRSKIEQAKFSPWGSDMSVNEYTPGPEKVPEGIKTEILDSLEEPHVEKEIEIIGQVTGTCAQEKGTRCDVIQLKREKSEIFQLNEGVDAESLNSGEIPSPEFEPLEPLNPRPIAEGMRDNLVSPDETPSMTSSRMSSDMAGDSNQSREKTVAEVSAGPSKGNKGSGEEPTGHMTPSYAVKCNTEGSPGVKFTKLRVQPDHISEKEKQEKLLRKKINKILGGQRNIPPGPPYEGGLMMDEATAKGPRDRGGGHKVFKTSREYYEYKKRVGEFGLWEKDGVLMYEVKDPSSGYTVFEYVTDPENPIFTQQTQQGVNYLRVPHGLTDPFIQIYNSTIIQNPQERLDFKINVGNWVRFVDTTLRFVGKPHQPISCALCTRDLPFNFIFYGIYDLVGHLQTYHEIDVELCKDLSTKLENGILPRGGYSVEPRQISKWMTLALEIRDRLRYNIRNPPRPYDPRLLDTGPPWITNNFGDQDFFLSNQSPSHKPKPKNKGKGKRSKSQGRSNQGLIPENREMSGSKTSNLEVDDESPSDILDLHPSENDWA